MKTLRFIRQKFELLGFSSNQPLWNLHRKIGFVQAGLAIPSFFAFFFYVADSIEELTFSIYVTSISIVIFIAFINTIHKCSKMISLFDMIDESVNKSESFSFEMCGS